MIHPAVGFPHTPRSLPFRLLVTALGLVIGLGPNVTAASLPVVTVTQDDTRIDRSCTIVIPPGTILADANSNGVLHVHGDRLTLRFAPGSELRGAAQDVPADQLTGIGIRVHGHRKVRIEQARVHGYFCGLVATEADRLEVVGGDYSDNYRQRLRSTPEAEDASDWLYPHHNDQRRWREEYGGAVCIEASDRITVREVRIRRGQNGILLDRVRRGRIYDNDASFLSGWGLALWRSSRNVIARNAFDFCVRGHVEGVYNRGQDAAGILCFEQCNDNVFAENSVTHGGDGFFGFAGREAIGEAWMDQEKARWRQQTGHADDHPPIEVPRAVIRRFTDRGCNRNLLWRNDFSYAAAHGIELTFSEDNRILENRLVENAICGFWGGYSSRTLVAANQFEANGGMAYGLERGAINMEHGADNRVLDNQFLNNRCGLHFWWDDDGALHRLPGVTGNLKGITGNVIARNQFVVDSHHPFGPLALRNPILLLQLRDAGQGHIRDNLWISNRVELGIDAARLWDVPAGAEPATNGSVPRYTLPRLRLPGTAQPVGARPHLRGRHQILFDDWGPWDHESPLVRKLRTADGRPCFDILGLKEVARLEDVGGSALPRITASGPGQATRIELESGPGVHAYRFRMAAADWQRVLSGTWVNTRWQATFFAWPTNTDPRQDLAGWRALADRPDAVRAELADLRLPYGWGGPRDQKRSTELTRNGPGPDRFGMIARCTLALPSGRWRFRTLSDDGVRVTVDGRPVLENWSWHGPTTDVGVRVQPVTAEVAIVVEHFEIDGYSVLQLDLEPAD